MPDVRDEFDSELCAEEIVRRHLIIIVSEKTR
jgi:hypothetical protein